MHFLLCIRKEKLVDGTGYPTEHLSNILFKVIYIHKWQIG